MLDSNIAMHLHNIEYFQSLVPSKRLDLGPKEFNRRKEKGHSERQKYREEQGK